MQDSMLELIVACVGFLFITFIICNIKGKNNITKKKEDFKNCPITQSEYNSLTNTWDEAVVSGDLDYIPKLYSPKLKSFTNDIVNKIGNCYDDNLGVNKYSEGDCPNCEYAKNLFKHMDFNSDKNLGFGPLSNYCPNSLNSPGAQICLRKLTAGMQDIRNLTTAQLQSQLSAVALETEAVGKNSQQLAANVDTKIKRDYIDYYLKHHKPYEDAAHKFRKGIGAIDQLNNTYQPPKINTKQRALSDEPISQLTLPMMALKPLFGHYQFDGVHLKTIMLGQNNIIRATDNDIDKLMRSQISIDENGIYIQYEDGTEQSGISYESIMSIPNIKNTSGVGYRLTGQNGIYELHPESEDSLYLKINMTTNTSSSQFMQNTVYLLTKM